MIKILNQINSPQDIKRLSISELEELAKEIREVIIQTCSKTGGHLSASLGVVELTLALHFVLDSPVDKIIWDVGHQSYAHKLITGRRDKFSTLRQYKGLSGFPMPQESEYDSFGTGHGSTSISAALGMAIGRDLKARIKGEGLSEVIAVIGDGGMSGGMAFEALNHTGHLKTKLIVVLNDNEMFISPRVGALSNYLSRLRLSSAYLKAREEFQHILEGIPQIGGKMFRFAKRVKDSVKHLIMPGVLFEELGFKYLGPIDGHNIEILIKTLQVAINLEQPVLIHILTKKGKGYEHAENDAVKYHGISPFDPDTGEVLSKSPIPSYTQVFAQTLIELAELHPEIVAITAAMPEGTGLSLFAQKFPDRFFDVGMAEQHAVTFAAGLAASSFKPVVAIYSTFLQRAYDQILHDICLQKLPVVFALDRAGIVGEDGATHQGIFDISYLRHIPNIILMSPKDENELRSMLKTAILYNKGPIAIRYPRGAGIGCSLDKDIKSLPIGKAEVLTEGKDILILAVGNMVYPAKKAAEKLSEEKIYPTVINVRFIKPLDEELIIKYARLINKIITIEENTLKGGFGSLVLELLAEKFERGNFSVKCLGIPDEFVEHGSPKILREKYGLNSEGIYKTAKKMIEED